MQPSPLFLLPLLLTLPSTLTALPHPEAFSVTTTSTNKAYQPTSTSIATSLPSKKSHFTNRPSTFKTPAPGLVGPPRGIKARRTTSALLPSFHITPKELRDLFHSFASKTSEASLVPPPILDSPKKRDDSSIASSIGPNDETLSGLPIGLYQNGDSPGKQGVKIAQVPAVPADELKYHKAESALAPPSRSQKSSTKYRKREQSNEVDDMSSSRGDVNPTAATPPSSDPHPLQASVAPEPANASSYLNFKDKTAESALVPPPEATP